jgi:arginine utilization regulatory protein
MKRREKFFLFPGVDPGDISLLPVLDQYHEGVMIIDASGVIQYMNEAQAKIDDLVAEEAIGHNVSALYRVDEGISPTMTCLKTGKAIEKLACYYRTHLGRVVNSIHNVYPITAKGQIIGAICFITDYKNIEQTFASVIKSMPPRWIPTYGVSPVSQSSRAMKNGTRYTFDGIIGEDKNLLSTIKSAQLASESPSSVLIYGETGTGKELFAQSIHNQSPRCANPYVAINCAAIPENLLEGMLFGTSKGAFTGAIDKAGLFETADGGTVFLDEVNSMSQGLQAKLLRFLQERKLRRVGAMKEIDVDLKIISSTNISPHQAIDENVLRSDLFYRLAVVFIHIPPLRERKGDLNRLITHFLAKSNRHLGKRVTGIAMDVMEQFKCYPWPGNVRELEHVIEGAMNLVGAGKTIERHHLPVPLQFKDSGNITFLPDTFSTPGNSGHMRMVYPSSPDDPPSPKKTLAEEKMEHEIVTIVAALTDTQGNAARAARKLGISPQLMNYKLKRFNINRLDYQ